MKHAKSRAAALALLLAAYASAAAAAALPITMTFKNSSGRAGEIYVGFVGGAGSTLVATDIATHRPILMSTYKAPHWYALSALKSGIRLAKFLGGRIYVCYDAPWTFIKDSYEPSPVDSGDANYYRRYDKMELTYQGSPYDVADTTSIDYFSIPMELNVYQGGTSGKRISSVLASPTDRIVSALSQTTVPAGAAIVTDPKTKQLARVIGPGAYPPPPGRPVSPYDNFESYLKYLRDDYAPKHGGLLASIKGRFGGVGEAPTTAPTTRQDYGFKATIDASLDITLTGSADLVGKHTLKLSHDALVGAEGIYGANPNFSIDGEKPIHPQNDIYGWLIGDLLSGLNIGAVGSTVKPAGQDKAVGEMNSQDWFKLKQYFGALQPGHPNRYNQWAATMAPLSQAYNFAYSDRFAHVVATLDRATVDTLEIVILPDR